MHSSRHHVLSGNLCLIGHPPPWGESRLEMCGPPISRETYCLPFTSRTSPVTPKGFRAVTLTSLFDMPGCNIETVYPVSTIKFLSSPSMRTVIERAPCSTAIGTWGLLTAFSEGKRREELSLFTPLCHFPVFPALTSTRV